MVSKTSSKLLEKASDNNIAGLQYYTVREMTDKLSTEQDIDQYKLLSVEESPLDCRQEHIDTLCFPVLFPDGKFEKKYHREFNLMHSEFEKSRLFNKDSRFRKHMQYILYILKQKEARELNCTTF